MWVSRTHTHTHTHTRDRYPWQRAAQTATNVCVDNRTCVIDVTISYVVAAAAAAILGDNVCPV